MTANTPISGLPYPEGTDRVADGDNAIQALATALDPWAASSSGVLVGGGSVNMGDSSGVYRRGKLGILVIESIVTTAPIAANAVLLTVPVGFRPLMQTRFGLFALSNQYTSAAVAVNGGIYLTYAIGTGQTLYGSCVFIIG